MIELEINVKMHMFDVTGDVPLLVCALPPSLEYPPASSPRAAIM